MGLKPDHESEVQPRECGGQREGADGELWPVIDGASLSVQRALRLGVGERLLGPEFLQFGEP
jgi:hypothetical protein